MNHIFECAKCIAYYQIVVDFIHLLWRNRVKATANHTLISEHLTFIPFMSSQVIAHLQYDIRLDLVRSSHRAVSCRAIAMLSVWCLPQIPAHSLWLFQSKSSNRGTENNSHWKCLCHNTFENNWTSCNFFIWKIFTNED